LPGYSLLLTLVQRTRSDVDPEGQWLGEDIAESGDPALIVEQAALGHPRRTAEALGDPRR